MQSVFVAIYKRFDKSVWLFWSVLVSCLAFIVFGATHIDFEEDITKFFPDDKRVEKLNFIFENSAFADRIAVMVSIADSASAPAPDSLGAVTEQLVDSLTISLKPFDVQIKSRVDDENIREVFNVIHEHLPVFLEDDDYRFLDSIATADGSKTVLRENYRQLLSPTGIVVKQIIAQDPLGFSFLVMKKIQRLQYDENFELYDNFLITRDHRHLLFFIQTSRSSGEIDKNKDLVGKIEQTVNGFNDQTSLVKISYFGATVVAVGNSNVLRKDTILTTSLMIVFLALILVGYFKKKRTLLFILLPAVFGALFSLTCIGLLQGTVSILALAAGSIILGIAVNYALHYLVHLRHNPDPAQTIRDLVAPLTVGSTTTVLAFFCLQFTNAAVLQDLGLFAGFSLIGAALFSLIFLPHLARPYEHRENFVERLKLFSSRPDKKWVMLIFVLTPVFLYFAYDVKFNNDMSSLNYMETNVREAEKRLAAISPASLHAAYMASEAPDLEHALRKNEVASSKLNLLTRENVVSRYQPVSAFLISDSLQQIRLKKWNAFWSESRRNEVSKAVHEEGAALKFSPRVLHNFDSLIEKKFKPLSGPAFDLLQKTFFDGNIVNNTDRSTVVSMINVMPGMKPHLYEEMNVAGVTVVDRQMITNLFVEFVHEDFNFIVTFTSLLVFVVLLVTSGRIEITLMTFTPMLITWIWILGIMALLGIEFNIINVIVSTFIFGLGDDYSIFVMDGLQQEYKSGKVVLPSVRVSIMLSAVTTILGLGVLIFAEHPALRSIAAIAIIGIVCVFIMSQTIEPFLFDFFITNRTKKGLAPMTALGIFHAFLTYSLFVFGSFFLTIVGLVLKVIPFGRQRVKLLYHHLIRFFTSLNIRIAFQLRKKIMNNSDELFLRPRVIIANHSSFLDILVTAMLHPRVVLLTNKWVWNSPVFGGVVRLADYHPVMEGADESIQRLKKAVDLGYSIVVFPEGTRSPDGKIGRFHKGAFYLAEKLELPISPLLIFGASHSIPKGTLYVVPGPLTLKFLPEILPNDLKFGSTYQERTKAIGKYFKSEFKNLALQETTPENCRHRLYSNYIYKSPVLEWYMRIKLKLEKNYEVFHRLIPLNATVLDLGCGYGFLSYMLQFLSDDRIITGVDYDQDKIDIAQHGYLKTSRLNFHCADVTKFPIGSHDAIVISDVLHYLLPDSQNELLASCFEALKPGGKIIIRDGNADLQQRHEGTKLTELFSVKLLKFNKSENSLNFISGKALTDMAQSRNLQVEMLDDGKFTSNVIFVISKEKELHAAV